MLDKWINAPYDPNDLPWPIKAGRRMLWTVYIPAHGEWPDKSFVFTGSIKECLKRETTVVADKEEGWGGGFFYPCIQGYMECPEPFQR